MRCICVGESLHPPPTGATPFDLSAFACGLGRLGGGGLAASCGLVLAA